MGMLSNNSAGKGSSAEYDVVNNAGRHNRDSTVTNMAVSVSLDMLTTVSVSLDMLTTVQQLQNKLQVQLQRLTCNVCNACQVDRSHTCFVSSSAGNSMSACAEPVSSCSVHSSSDSVALRRPRPLACWYYPEFM